MEPTIVKEFQQEKRKIQHEMDDPVKEAVTFRLQDLNKAVQW